MQKPEIFFFRGQEFHPLWDVTIKKLSELYGKRLEFSHIDYNTHGEKELNNSFPSVYDKIKNNIVVFFSSLTEPLIYLEALDFIWAAKHQYGAKKVILVSPFLINRRQDPTMEDFDNGIYIKKGKPHEIQRLDQTMYFLSCAGVDELIVATAHSKAMHLLAEKHKIKFTEIDLAPSFAYTINTYISKKERDLLICYAPDLGSVERTVELAKLLNCKVMFSMKERSFGETSIITAEIDQIKEIEVKLRKKYKFNKIYYLTESLVQDKIFVMREDEATTCKTANDTGRLIKKYKAKALYIILTHPVLIGDFRAKLYKDEPFEKVIMTNSIFRTANKRTNGKIVDICISTELASSLYTILELDLKKI